MFYEYINIIEYSKKKTKPMFEYLLYALQAY
jgi:hypothetical protein